MSLPAGYALIPHALPADELATLRTALAALPLAPRRGGIRRIDQHLPAVAELARSAPFLQHAQAHVRGPAQLVRAIYFDKTAGNNWFVTWHQDRTVAVSQRFEAPGWGPWSMKAGTWHVQPPLEVLDEMITLRLHLDPATRDNGCLKLIPGSHQLGLLPTATVMEHVTPAQVVHCEANAGDLLLMRPHILHASDKATSNAPRRILHLEYAGYRLPDGVGWAA
jgi:hypothetical protein